MSMFTEEEISEAIRLATVVPSKLCYLAFAEGFLKYRLDKGDTHEMISSIHFTADIRKATPVTDRRKAAGIAKYVIESGRSKNQYYCLLTPEQLY